MATKNSVSRKSLYATLSIVASWRAPKLPLHPEPDSLAPVTQGMGDLMTVLVTGGAGYIGSHMVLALAEAGESVVVIDNLSTGFSTSLPEGVPLFIGDAADENLVEGVIAAHGVESIVHFAGSVVVPDSMRDPLAYYRNNTMTTRSLLNTAVKCGVNRFHLLFDRRGVRQSRADAGGRGRADAAAVALRLIQTDDRNHAARCRRRARHELCRAALFQCRRRRSAGAHRSCHRRRHASAEDRGRGRYRPARQDRRLSAPTIRRRTEAAVRDFIHVSDLAQAHRAALSYLRAGGASTTLNCGYGRGYSVLETIEAVRRVSGRNFAVQTAPRRPGDIMTMIADTSRIASHAGLDAAIRRSRNHRGACAGLGREAVPGAPRRRAAGRFGLISFGASP